MSSSKKASAEAEEVDDLSNENDLYAEELDYPEAYRESNYAGQGESDEPEEPDFISKLGSLIDQKKAQTKYVALNINGKLTMEQRRVLERVFDLIIQEYDRQQAEGFIYTIAKYF